MTSILEWFWWLLAIASVLWYVSITFYVAVRGAFDVKHMLRRLANAMSDDADDAE